MFRKGRGLSGWLFGSPIRIDPARETAWLDGVRGVAAFLVMISHYSMEWLSPYSDAPFGAVALQNRNPDMVWYYKKGDRLLDLWRLPIIRSLMCSGDAQVAIFFVLSGFVLSWSPLISVRAARYEKLYQSLGSSTIRRWFRLFVPCLVVTIAYLMQRLYETYHGISPALEEIWFFVTATEKWANPFEINSIMTMTSIHPYSFVMWTIPFEFSGSIFVYVALLGFGRIQSYHRRICATVFVSLYAMLSLNWGYWLFGSGLAVADYVQQAGGFRKLPQRTSRRSTCIWLSVFGLGLYLMGYVPPNEWYTTPGYEWVQGIPLPPGYKEVTGPGRFWWGWGGILVIISSCHLNGVRRFFELPLIQYLGRISFMLYLIHILINVTIAKPLRSAIYERFSAQEISEIFGGFIFITTPLMNVSVYCLLSFICIPMAMGLAHLMELYLDRPCTRFGKWVDNVLVDGVRNVQSLPDVEQHLLNPTRSLDLEMRDVSPR